MKPEEIVVSQLLEAMEKGIVPWRKSWTVAPAMNLDGRQYTGINRIILEMKQMMNEYSCSKWVTYKRAIKEDMPVKKGEHGTQILFWKPVEYENEDGEKYTRGFWRYYNVFNLEQCEGYEPEKATTITEIPHADTVVEMYEDCPTIRHGSNSASYSPLWDEVYMPVKSAFDTAEDYYRVLFHELAHSTGHKKRLDRFVSSNAAFGSEEYSKEELIAELASCFLSTHCGIGMDTDMSASYINGWKKYIKDNPHAIVSAASKATKASDYILNK